MDNLPVKQATLGIFIVLAALIFLFWWPFALIWCVNTLFRTEIPMDFRTWLATVVLVVMLRLLSTKNDKFL